MKTVVTKFGGSSLADAAQFRKVAAILRTDPARRYVVASAPGKRTKDDIKVTDLLYACYEKAAAGEDFSAPLEEIRARFAEIAAELAVDFPLDAELITLRDVLKSRPQKDYAASRGEYLNSRLLAAYLGIPFVDAAPLVVFSADGIFDSEETDRRLADALRDVPAAVVPGFYGASDDGTVHTFSRGGSDITGSLVARAVGADLYENWTDVSGMLFTDPRIVPSPRTIPFITYRELRELSYMGASVLHENAVFPAFRAGIPINIRNTNRPEDDGTMIVSKLPESAVQHAITGMAGRKGYTSIQVEKTLMNDEVGFGARLLNIFSDHGIPFEHTPTGIDAMSVVVKTERFAPCREAILEQIRKELQPDTLLVHDGLALIAVVGCGMISIVGPAARILRAVADAGINLRMADAGSGEMNFIVGVSDEDFEDAMRAIYSEMKE